MMSDHLSDNTLDIVFALGSYDFLLFNDADARRSRLVLIIMNHIHIDYIYG